MVEPGALPPPPPPPPVQTAPRPPEVPAPTVQNAPAGSGPGAWPWVVGSLGLVAGGVAAGFGADYGAAKSTIASDCPLTNATGQLVCDQRHYALDDAHALQQRRDRDLGAAVGLGVAGGGAVLAAIIGLVAGRRDTSSASSVGVLVAPWGARAGGLLVQGAL